jgi:hypothetical protein
MSKKNFKATFTIDGKVEKQIVFSSTNPFHSESEKIRDAKVEIHRQTGFTSERLSNLVVINLD